MHCILNNAIGCRQKIIRILVCKWSLYFYALNIFFWEYSIIFLTNNHHYRALCTMSLNELIWGCTSVHTFQVLNRWKHIHEIWYWSILRKTVERSTFLFKAKLLNYDFTRRPSWVSAHISLFEQKLQRKTEHTSLGVFEKMKQNGYYKYTFKNHPRVCETQLQQEDERKQKYLRIDLRLTWN
jgi:hypothetical protein